MLISPFELERIPLRKSLLQQEVQNPLIGGEAEYDRVAN